MSNARFEVTVGMHSQIGTRHQREGTPNEDAMNMYGDVRYAAVVLGDGVGGYPGGKDASNLVVNSYVEGMDIFARQPDITVDQLALSAAAFAHHRLKLAKKGGTLHPLAATTLVAMVADLNTGRFIEGWSGDSYGWQTTRRHAMMPLVGRDEAEGGELTACMDGRQFSYQQRGYTPTAAQNRLGLASDGIEGIEYRDNIAMANGPKALSMIESERAKALNHPSPRRAAEQLVEVSAAQPNYWVDDTSVAIIDLRQR